MVLGGVRSRLGDRWVDGRQRNYFLTSQASELQIGGHVLCTSRGMPRSVQTEQGEATAVGRRMV